MSWNQAVAAIQNRTNLAPTVGVILGSGLGAFASELEDAVEIPYGDIPGWPVSTAIGHACKLVFGKIGETVVKSYDAAANAAAIKAATEALAKAKAGTDQAATGAAQLALDAEKGAKGASFTSIN